MKTKVYILLALIAASFPVWADLASYTPFHVVQPNGDSICIVHCGDEYVSWYETTNGNVVAKDNLGRWRYMIADADTLRMSDNLVKQSHSPATDLNFVSTKTEAVEQDKIESILAKLRGNTIVDIDNYFQPFDPNDEETSNAVKKRH